MYTSILGKHSPAMSLLNECYLYRQFFKKKMHVVIPRKPPSVKYFQPEVVSVLHTVLEETRIFAVVVAVSNGTLSFNQHGQTLYPI